MEFKDYYATLGVGKTASGSEIKQAYRKLARKFHPDVNPGDKASEARFKEVNEAHEVLGDPEKRRKYDELGANWRYYEQAQQAGFGGGPFGGSPFEGVHWTANTGGPSGFRVMTDDEVHTILGDEDPFSDFFKAFFGGAGSQARTTRAPRGRRGRDIEQRVNLTLEEAYHGAVRRISIKERGRARSVEVRIPPGVREGSRVRAAGEGESGSGGATSGDLFLLVHLQPHPRFERKGDDLHVRVPLEVTTAVLGGAAQVPTLTGSSLRLRIPETTQPGQVFRLKGQGMPVHGKPGHRGDLFATIEVTLPRRLTPEIRALYERLASLEKPETVGSRS